MSKSEIRKVEISVREEIEAELREQIAKEIEAVICKTCHPTPSVQSGCSAERYSYERAANIARGK